MGMKNLAVAAFLLCIGIQVGCAQSGRSGGNDTQKIVDRIVESEIPVVVDFWASWCPACRMLEPVLDELKKEYNGRAQFIQVDVDKHRPLAQFFEVSGIPMVFIIDDKTVRTALSGARPREDFVEAIDAVLKASAKKK